VGGLTSDLRGVNDPLEVVSVGVGVSGDRPEGLRWCRSGAVAVVVTATNTANAGDVAFMSHGCAAVWLEHLVRLYD